MATVGSADCWSAFFTQEFCCDPSYVAGNPTCWDAVYTFEKCCPVTNVAADIRQKSQASVDVTLAVDCWSGVFNEQFCCDASYAAGHPLCWDDVYTYERCCPAKVTANSSHNRQTMATTAGANLAVDCWSGVFTEPFCCIANVSECWSGIFTYEECCQSCWAGNRFQEKACCNAFKQDSLSWREGHSLQNRCKRDPGVVAALSAVRDDLVLEVTARPNLELPFQDPPAGLSAGGHLQDEVHAFLEHSEHQLRHPGCWHGIYTREYCCPPSLPRGNHECFSSIYTYNRCCLEEMPQVTLLQKFYRCEHCVSSFRRSVLTRTFSCEDVQLCWSLSGTIIAASKGNGSIDILCLPTVTEDLMPASSAVFALQWVSAHHATAPHVDIISRNDFQLYFFEILPVLVPWLMGALHTRFWSRSGKAQQAVHREQAGKDVTIDCARMVGVLAVVLIHLNINRNSRHDRAIWRHAYRFIDVFDVVSVLVHRSHSESLLDSLDALWRKLARQLPLSYVLLRANVWSAGICPNVESCLDVQKLPWSLDTVVTCLTFSYQWQLHMDLKVWLALRSVYIFNYHGVPPTGVLAFMASTFLVLYPHQPANGLYYEFSCYRLPMSFLVLAVSLCRKPLLSWGERFPLFWSSLAALLCSLGWLRCLPHVPDKNGDLEALAQTCTDNGPDFFWGGVFFHLGVAMCCLQPAVAMPRALRGIVSRIAPLALGIVTLHDPWLFWVLHRCQRMSSPWFFFQGYVHQQPTRTSLAPDLPFWVGASFIAFAVIVAQLVLWTVQQPWERLFMQCPKPLSRVLVVAYLLLFAWQQPSLDRRVR
ncbi:unnamed protein product [Symbiodinium natans]|uniref:Uncharacterized protein n=1 Tax=Symbiodinium natans TaxID=878477 RepID=A0A812S274_9DINO|nr:unnamed protein product [Symbiodinium natans]